MRYGFYGTIFMVRYACLELKEKRGETCNGGFGFMGHPQVAVFSRHGATSTTFSLLECYSNV